jgi:hypothetical protein
MRFYSSAIRLANVVDGCSEQDRGKNSQICYYQRFTLGKVNPLPELIIPDLAPDTLFAKKYRFLKKIGQRPPLMGSNSTSGAEFGTPASTEDLCIVGFGAKPGHFSQVVK